MTGWTDEARAKALESRRAKAANRHQSEASARRDGSYPVTSHAGAKSVGSHTGGYNVSALDERSGRYDPVVSNKRQAVAENVSRMLRFDKKHNMIFK